MTDYLNTTTDKQSFDPMPAGQYQVMIEKIEFKQTKKKQEGLAMKGEVLEVAFTVLNDKFAGRKIFERYNLANDNEQAQNIGRAQFASLAKALGITIQLNEPVNQAGQIVTHWDTRKTAFETKLGPQLKDKVCVLELKVAFDDFKQEDVNKIKKYVPKDLPIGNSGHSTPTTGKGPMTHAELDTIF